MKKLPRTLAVVGGGVIGVEYTSMFAALGVRVTLVERRDRPLEFLDREIVDGSCTRCAVGTSPCDCGETVATIEEDRIPPTG